MTNQLVSIHGGHSGQFCNHAADDLEEIVQAYIEQGFSWVGITEHIPPVNDVFLYPEEIEAGLTAVILQHRFNHYIHTCRQLQIKYAPFIKLFVGFEGENYSGTIPFIQQLITQFKPDYVVGSLHHVDDIPFDFNQAEYERAITAVNGIDALHGRYFDQQYTMIDTLHPQVVGHFDHIRRFDDDYLTRLQKPAIWSRILRNLRLIKKLGLILDYNVAALQKGSQNPLFANPFWKRPFAWASHSSLEMIHTGLPPSAKTSAKESTSCKRQVLIQTGLLLRQISFLGRINKIHGMTQSC